MNIKSWFMRFPLRSAQREAIVCAVFLVSIAVQSCGGGNVIDPIIAESAQEYVRQGWAAYRIGDYSDAVKKFDLTKKLDPNYAEAYNGLGWSHFGQLNLPSAESNFVISLSLDSTKMDPMVGSIFVLYTRNKYREALNFSNRVFRADSVKFFGEQSRYIFQHNSKANASQVHKVVALCHYYLGEFTRAYDHILLYVNPALNLDPQAPGFPQKLLEEIKKL